MQPPPSVADPPPGPTTTLPLPSRGSNMVPFSAGAGVLVGALRLGVIGCGTGAAVGAVGLAAAAPAAAASALAVGTAPEVGSAAGAAVCASPDGAPPGANGVGDGVDPPAGGVGGDGDGDGLPPPPRDRPTPSPTPRTVATSTAATISSTRKSLRLMPHIRGVARSCSPNEVLQQARPLCCHLSDFDTQDELVRARPAYRPDSGAAVQGGTSSSMASCIYMQLNAPRPGHRAQGAQCTRDVWEGPLLQEAGPQQCAAQDPRRGAA